jgi:hypothetical protein
MKSLYEISVLIADKEENNTLDMELDNFSLDENNNKIEVLHRPSLEEEDLKLFCENVNNVINKCPSYFKISKEYEYELLNSLYYNNFIEHIFDKDIRTLEINNLRPQCEVQDLFIGFKKPKNYSGNVKIMEHNGTEYIGVGILYVLKDNNKIFLKSYSTYEKMYFC